MSNYISPEGLFQVHPIRGYHGLFHLLHDAERKEAVLIDTGLVGEMSCLAGTLKKIGLGWSDIKAILLTHGHLDHTGNLAELKEMTGAPIFAHPLEQLHIEGKFPYRGPSRLCGMMEAVGRGLFKYRSAPIDQPLVPGEELPYWGGLKVIYLPGHTGGHCGFYSQRFDLLFSGDLFASYWFSTHLPPFFLNSCADKFPGSLRKVTELSPRYVVPNHYDNYDYEKNAQKLKTLAARATGSLP
jgi:glyoxylase-like metal-dependent hydrolase (beta-lactamase superfamily II)